VQGTATCELITAQLRGRWEREVRFDSSISPTGKRNLTLTAAGADKGVALAAACADIGIDPRDAVAFGDSDNDIELFRVAGASFAMGQASAEVKAHASAVTLSCEEDGVAAAIERLLAQGEDAFR
jgi:5-amino-6-(5-phospho-D-ribitylamino)uracil phosphatase